MLISQPYMYMMQAFKMRLVWVIMIRLGHIMTILKVSGLNLLCMWFCLFCDLVIVDLKEGSIDQGNIRLKLKGFCLAGCKVVDRTRLLTGGLVKGNTGRERVLTSYRVDDITCPEVNTHVTSFTKNSQACF